MTSRTVFSRLWDGYIHSLNRRPLVTKVSAATLIFFTSDSITQYLLHNKGQSNERESKEDRFHWDIKQAVSSASFGVIGTTWIHYWWGYLEFAIGARIPAARYKLLNTVTKVMIDQGIGAPLYIYSYYVITNFINFDDKIRNNNNGRIPPESTTLSERLDVVTAKASAMFIPTLQQHYKLWPAVHCINFYFIPLQHRAIVQNTVLVGWSGYLSYLNNHENTTSNKLTTRTTISATAKARKAIDNTTAGAPEILASSSDASQQARLQRQVSVIVRTPRDNDESANNTTSTTNASQKTIHN